MLKVQEFIKANSDWECLLSSEPYCLFISYDKMFGRNLVMFKYNQLDSDLGNPIVQECRGLILDADTFEVVSFPFTKFFNYGEANAVDVDWRTSYVTEKIDGSIVKVVNLDGNFLISTNGVIDAFKCSLSEKDEDKGLLFFNPRKKEWYNLPKLNDMIEPMKDDLNALLIVFEALEKRLMVQPEKTKSKKKGTK